MKIIELLLHFLLPCSRMKTRSFILRCATFLLLLAFSQKTGAGLFLHNLLHAESTTPVQQDDKKSRDISFSCSCIDDFLMPFTEADATVLVPPFANHSICLSSSPVTIPFRPAVFSSLRGPPVSLL